MATTTEKIRQCLKEKKGTQTWLAYATGISESQLSRILCGHRRLTVEECEYICGALDVEPGQLLEKRKRKGKKNESSQS